MNVIASSSSAAPFFAHSTSLGRYTGPSFDGADIFPTFSAVFHPLAAGVHPGISALGPGDTWALGAMNYHAFTIRRIGREHKSIRILSQPGEVLLIINFFGEYLE